MILWYIVSIGGADAELGIGAVVIALGALGDGKVGLLASAAVGQSIKFAFESIGPQVGTCDGILRKEQGKFPGPTEISPLPGILCCCRIWGASHQLWQFVVLIHSQKRTLQRPFCQISFLYP